MRGKANHRESALPDTIERTTIDRTQLRPSVAARGATPLAELRSVVARRFEDAVAMPPSVYTDAGFGERELERIFRREWICVGRAGGVAKPGDYLTYQVAGQPIAVIRGRDGELRAFSNVCLHRMSTLLEGAGNARAIVCPYHAWTYNLDGTLRAAPHMHKTTGFCKAAYRLPAIRCEAWRGWLYVTLNADVEAVSARLAPLDDPIADYAMEGYVETFREEHVWDTNWKVLAENFMESYHLPMLHWGTVGAHSKVDDMACPPGYPTFNYHWITKQASLPIGNAHPDNDRLRGRGRWRQTAALITVYPSHLITLTPGYFWYLVVHPRGVGRVHITYGGGLAPEYLDAADAAANIGALKTLLDAVNDEDRRGVEAVYRGMRAGLAKGGHLSYLERPIYDFAQYLARQLG